MTETTAGGLILSKKNISAALLFFMLSCLTFDLAAQNNLTEQQLMLFNSNKLSVQHEATVRYNSGIDSTSTVWNAYKGHQPISEEKFFKTAGYEKEAVRARKYKEQGNLILGRFSNDHSWRRFSVRRIRLRKLIENGSNGGLAEFHPLV